MSKGVVVGASSEEATTPVGVLADTSTETTTAVPAAPQDRSSEEFLEGQTVRLVVSKEKCFQRLKANIIKVKTKELQVELLEGRVGTKLVRPKASFVKCDSGDKSASPKRDAATAGMPAEKPAAKSAKLTEDQEAALAESTFGSPLPKF